ncbi:MAG: adenosylhomocysteinase [Thermotogaceae bacterium]|nr:adenosylhomocysteinase [Thermotogaceae bacterium]
MDTGKLKLNWVERYMDVLNEVQKEYKEKEPLKGIKVGISVHLEAKTGYLAITLKRLGADVYLTGSNPLSTQDDVANALKDFGINVFAKRTHDEKEYWKGIHSVLDAHPDFIVDDGADLTVTAHTEKQEVLEDLKGVTEETTTGVKRLRALEKKGKLQIPVIAVNDAYMKSLFDNRYGTGQSTWDSIMRNTNLLVAGKYVVVAGYGWCGKGVAMRAEGLGAKVIVTEVDPIKAIEAVMDGYEVMTMDEAAQIGDFFVTVTGNKGIIGKEHFLKMKDGAVLANAGHFDVEIDMRALEEIAVEKFEARMNVTGYKLENGRTLYVVGEGRLVNLAAADGHPVEIMDLSFALQALSVLYLVENHKKLENKVYRVPKEIDEKVAKLKLRSMGIKIDEMTPEQKEYLESW